MPLQLKAAALTFVTGLGFVALEFLLRLQTAIAGVFIVGMSAGFLLPQCSV
jgi:hypothetical protein